MSPPSRADKGRLARFRKDQSGATALEYALIAGLLSIVVAGAVTGLGHNLYNLMGNVTSALNSVH